MRKQHALAECPSFGAGSMKDPHLCFSAAKLILIPLYICFFFAPVRFTKPPFANQPLTLPDLRMRS